MDIRVAPGSHATEAAGMRSIFTASAIVTIPITWLNISAFFLSVNKQLNDKERVAAALENPNLLDMVEECLSPTFD